MFRGILPKKKKKKKKRGGGGKKKKKRGGEKNHKKKKKKKKEAGKIRGIVPSGGGSFCDISEFQGPPPTLRRPQTKPQGGKYSPRAFFCLGLGGV